MSNLSCGTHVAEPSANKDCRKLLNQFCRFLPKLKLPISADAKLPLTTHKSNMVQNLLQPPSLNENELSSYNNLFKSKTFEQVLDFFFTLFVCLLQYVSLNGIVQEYHRLYKI